MTKQLQRISGRAFNQLRPISITYNAFGYADGSVLYELGNTKVLCTVTLQSGVPPFLKGTRTGWLSAEYALLPNSTQNRSMREGNGHKPNGRSIEIARFIGRSLRSMVDLNALGERTISVDCDVLQADGGTRTACITASALALKAAVKKWIQIGQLSETIIVEDIAALSVGLRDLQPLLDIDYQEDAAVNADYNFVMTRNGTLVEVQGTTEKGLVSWESFFAICTVAQEGIQQLFKKLDAKVPSQIMDTAQNKKNNESSEKIPLFSLKNRFSQQQR